MQTLWQDLRYGARMLWKKPGFTLIAVITLALGIGATTAIFGLFDKLLLRKLPVTRPDELVLITSESGGEKKFIGNVFSWRDYEDFEQTSGMAGVAASTFLGGDLKFGANAAGVEPMRVNGMYVSGNYFNVLGVAVTQGRLIGADDCRDEGGHPVAVLSYAFWQRQFGGDPQVVGHKVTLNKIDYTVIGVAARDFVATWIERPAELWVPLTQMRQLGSTPYREEKVSCLQLIGRMAAGVGVPQAQTQLEAVARAAREQRLTAAERANPFNQKKMLLDSIARGVSMTRDQQGTILKLMLGMTALLLLVACANVATLLLARAQVRRREMAIRLAIGAGRWRLLRQLLTESAWLAALGAALGLWLAPFLNDFVLRFWVMGEDRPPMFENAVDRRVLLFTVAVTGLATLLCGLAPAWQSSRTELVYALKDAAGSASSVRRGWGGWNLRHALIVLQLSLAVIVLTGAGLFVRSLQHLLNVDSGMQLANVYAVSLELPQKTVDSKDKTAARKLEAEYHNRMMQVAERTRALPGVSAVSVSAITPFEPSWLQYELLVEGRETETAHSSFDTHKVAPDFHALLQILLVQGRSFTAADTGNAPPVVTVNETFARRFFPHESAVGKRVKLDKDTPWITIVGVTRDTRFHQVKLDTQPAIDFPLAQETNSNYCSLLIKADAAAWPLLTAELRKAVRQLEPEATLSTPRALSWQFDEHLSAERMAASLASLFGVLALTLAALGLYGLMTYAVSQRTHELGIRLALGARGRDIRWLVLRDGLRLVFAGLLFGLAAAAALTRLLTSELYGLRPLDPLTFAGTALLLSVIALLACWIPARRATKVDPMIVLRCE